MYIEIFIQENCNQLPKLIPKLYGFPSKTQLSKIPNQLLTRVYKYNQLTNTKPKLQVALQNKC